MSFTDILHKLSKLIYIHESQRISKSDLITEEADVLRIYSMPLLNSGFSLKRSFILICKHTNCSIIYRSSKSQSGHYLYMTMYEC